MKVPLLHLLVLRQSCLELALFLFLALNQGLRASERSRGLVAPFVQLRELWIERSHLKLDLANFQIVLLQR